MKRPLIAAALTLSVAIIAAFAAPSGQTPRRATLNPAALDRARKLIAEGHVVKDKHGDWAADKLLVDDENKFIQQHGTEEYGRWHLGIDESHRSISKARYKFPFGDFKNVHRCALIAVQNRARQYGYKDIEVAATELLTLIHAQSN